MSNFNKYHRIWNAYPEYYLNSWKYYTDFIGILKKRNVKFITMSDAYSDNYNSDEINVILDHHIDHYPLEMEVMCRWELKNGVKSSIYLFNKVTWAIHAQNDGEPWCLEDLNIPFYQQLERSGFEIGYHQNAIGQATKDNQRSYAKSFPEEILEKAKAFFESDVDNLNKYFNIRTFIPHGGGEGNAYMVDLPSKYENLIWAYNNRKLGKHYVRWENFNDSVGLSPNIVRVKSTYLLLNRDNIHVKAYVTGKGLHHILIHPGRFGKGMDYNEACESPEEKSCIQLTFRYPCRFEDMPLLIPELVKIWEGSDGERLRIKHCRQNYAELFIPRTNAKYYFLTNNTAALRFHLVQNPLCIGFLFSNCKWDKTTQQNLKRKKEDSILPISFPVPPERESHKDQLKIDELFQEQFAAYYNRIMSENIWAVLSIVKVPFKCVYLKNLKLKTTRELRFLFKFLEKCSPSTSVYIEVKTYINKTSWYKILQKEFVTSSERFDFIWGSEKKKLLFLWLVPSRDQSLVIVKSIVHDNCGLPYDNEPRDILKSAQTVHNKFVGKFDGQFPVKLKPTDKWGIVSDKDNNVNTYGTYQIYRYISHSLYCKKITDQDISFLHQLNVPEGILSLIKRGKNKRNWNTAIGGHLHAAFIKAPADADVLYSYLSERIYNTVSLEILKRDNATVIFSWQWSYLAEAAVLAFERTGEERFIKMVFDTFDIIAKRKDSDLGKVDEYRGRILPSWGSNYYTNYAISKEYESVKALDQTKWSCNVTAAGRIAIPIALAARAIRHTPEIQQKYVGRIEEYLDIIDIAMSQFIEDFREIDEGCGYIWRVERNEIEPLNHQNSYGIALILLADLKGKGIYRDMATRLARYFKRSICSEANGSYIWPYKGFNALDALKRSQKIEDIGHAHLNIDFAVTCNEYDIIFDKSDMQAFANTFLKNIYLGDRKFSPRISPGAEALIMKPMYPGHLLCWIVLSKFSDEIREIIEDIVSYRYDLFPENWFTSHISAYAYAYRLPQREK